MQPRTRLIIAIILTLISSLAYSVLIAMTKVAQTTINSEMVILFRYGVTFFLFIPYIMIKQPEEMRTAYPVKHGIRSVFGFLGLVTTIIATQYIPVVNAVLFSNTYPLFLPILIFFFERKKISLPIAFGILLGFIGIAYILKPDKSQMLNLFSILALSSGFFTAVTMMMVRQLSLVNTISQINFQFLSYSFVFAIILSLFNWNLPSKEQLPFLLLIGLVGTLYQQTFLWALKYAHSVIIAPIFYSSIVFGALIEWFNMGFIPTQTDVIGFALVFIGASITVIVGGQVKNLTRQ
jgi:drug/metabolite transporter (DMT)-like permease